MRNPQFLTLFLPSPFSHLLLPLPFLFLSQILHGLKTKKLEDSLFSRIQGAKARGRDLGEDLKLVGAQSKLRTSNFFKNQG